METKNLTSPEVAEKIMGKNFISLDEAIKIFPNKIDDLRNHDTIPFSKEVLYHCSDPENPFILFPAFPKCGKNMILDIREMHSIGLPHEDLFTQWKDIHLHKPRFIDKSVCESRWYLISKKVMTEKAKHQFCGLHEWSDLDFEIDRAVVYVYAWLLFKFARKENIFVDGPFRTLDTFSPVLNTLTYLDCKLGKIHISGWRPGDPNRPFEPGVIPSVEPFTPNSDINK